MNIFSVKADYEPQGDQPKAIRELTAGVKRGDRFQTLLGVTGSGKTFTMANLIANVGKPTLVVAHNKTLAAQLCNEFREFLPASAVEFFVSYYDYYQPEAYIAATDTYIEKKPQLMTSWISCGSRPRGRCSSAAIASLLPASPVSTAWARPKPITGCCCSWKKGRRFPGRRFSSGWSKYN